MNNQIIIAFSGRKQSGKDSAGNFLLKNQFELFPQFPDSAVVQKYALADPLKQFCMEYLDLTYEQCYGTDEQKNSLTHLRWENMPGVVTDSAFWFHHQESLVNFIYHAPGPMSGRETTQFVGTEIGRRMYAKIWLSKLRKNIVAGGFPVNAVCDVRFPDEVTDIQSWGGKIIRLTRLAPGTSDDSHQSEHALDPENFDWRLFDYVVHNQDSGLSKTHRAVVRALCEWGYATEPKAQHYRIIDVRGQHDPIGWN